MTPEETKELRALGARIKAAREAAKMTTRELEAHSSVDAANITKYEGGYKTPSYLTLIKLARGLNMSISELLSGL